MTTSIISFTIILDGIDTTLYFRHMPSKLNIHNALVSESIRAGEHYNYWYHKVIALVSCLDSNRMEDFAITPQLKGIGGPISNGIDGGTFNFSKCTIIEN